MKKIKKNLKIALATGMAIFSLATVFSSTLAWFALNNTVEATGMSIRVKEDGKAYKNGLTLHRCLTNESSANNLSFNHTPASGTQYKIDEYSQLNTTQPVLLLFPLGTVTAGVRNGVEATNVSLTVSSTTGAGYANVSTNSADPNYYGEFPFSSACTFRVIAWSDEIPTNDLVTRYYVEYETLITTYPDVGTNKAHLYEAASSSAAIGELCDGTYQYTLVSQSVAFNAEKLYTVIYDNKIGSNVSGDAAATAPVPEFVARTISHREFNTYLPVQNSDKETRCYVGQTQSFVTPGTDSMTWYGPTLTLFNGATIPNASNVKIKYLGVVIDYYQAALSVIFRAGGYSGPNPLDFEMDFTMVIS